MPEFESPQKQTNSDFINTWRLAIIPKTPLTDLSQVITFEDFFLVFLSVVCFYSAARAEGAAISSCGPGYGF